MFSSKSLLVLVLMFRSHRSIFQFIFPGNIRYKGSVSYMSIWMSNFPGPLVRKLFCLLLMFVFVCVCVCWLLTSPPGSSVHWILGFSREEYWSRQPFPSPGDLPDPGIKTGSSTLEADSLPSEPPGKP